MIVDTSVLLAYLDDQEPKHARCRDALDHVDDTMVLSPYVLAEFDYMMTTRHGVQAEIAALTELSGGAWELAPFTAEDVRDALKVIERYADQDIGLADASNVVLAARYRTRTIATLDRRPFEVLRPLTGGRFSIVP